MAIGVVAVALFLLLDGIILPNPAVAACGTSWDSKKEPPDVIRVLRTATDAVEKVDFADYVAVVMASGEWPTSLPEALLEAGALATKQYGWYYTLEGNHRSSDQNQAGECYDVRDDSTDQVYHPESAEPTDKQRAARDALWGLSLRKNDKFFLTGYRDGTATKCAADANEWKLYATSARDCAERLDYDSEQILRAYYSPKLTVVWAPGTEPEDTEPDQDPADSHDGSSDPQETVAPDEPPPSSPVPEDAEDAADPGSSWLDRLGRDE